MSEDSIDYDTILKLCQDCHRRIVLGVLASQQRPITVNDLSKAIIKYNHHAPITSVPGAEVTQIQHLLHHVHIPMLAKSGLLEYDRERKLVEPTAGFDRLEPQLAAIIDADPNLDAPVEL